MFALKTLLSLPAFLSTTIITHALAAPGNSLQNSDGYIDVDLKSSLLDYAASLTGGEGCNDKDLKYIRDGFHEMNLLLAATQNPDFERESEIEFFGRPYRIRNHTELIEGNLVRARRYANLRGDTTRNPDIHVRCDDPNDYCDEGNKKDGKHAAYNIGHEPHINFCKKYFKLDPLDEQVDDESGNGQSKFTLINYYNRATLWTRMVLHFSSIGSAVVTTAVRNLPNATHEWTMNSTTGPMRTSVLAGVSDNKEGQKSIRALKYAYGVTRAKLLATLSTQNDYDALNNAENYALYALAQYVTQKKGFFPNMPIVNFGNDMAVLTNEQILDGDKKRFACLSMPDVVPPADGKKKKEVVSSSSAVALWTSPGHVAASFSAAFLVTMVLAIS